MTNQSEEHSDAYARQSAARVATRTASTRLKAAQVHLVEVEALLSHLAENAKAFFDSEDLERSNEPEIGTTIRTLEAAIDSSLAKLPTQVNLSKDELEELRKVLNDLQNELEQPLFSPAPSAAPQPATPDVAPTTTLSMAMASLDERERGRMASIRTSLQLSSDEEVLESCVAVQNYFTAKVDEGWRIFLERKRERREVLLQSIGRG